MRTTKKGRKGALLLTFLLAGSLLFSGCKKEETVEYPAVIGCCDGIQDGSISLAYPADSTESYWNYLVAALIKYSYLREADGSVTLW